MEGCLKFVYLCTGLSVQIHRCRCTYSVDFGVVLALVVGTERELVGHVAKILCNCAHVLKNKNGSSRIRKDKLGK